MRTEDLRKQAAEELCRTMHASRWGKPASVRFKPCDSCDDSATILLPLFAAVRAEGAQEALEQAASAFEWISDTFFPRGAVLQKYNGYTVANLLRERAWAIGDES